MPFLFFLQIYESIKAQSVEPVQVQSSRHRFDSRSACPFERGCELAMWQVSHTSCIIRQLACFVRRRLNNARSWSSDQIDNIGRIGWNIHKQVKRFARERPRLYNFITGK